MLRFPCLEAFDDSIAHSFAVHDLESVLLKTREVFSFDSCRWIAIICNLTNSEICKSSKRLVEVFSLMAVGAWNNNLPKASR